METYERYKEAIDNWTFHGTEQYYKLSLFPVVVTDGAFWFFDNFECYWLHDAICKFMLEHKNDAFIVVNIKSKNKEADISYEDGNYKVLGTQHFDITSLPEGEYTVWCANRPGNRVIYLNTEH